ncbi:type-2 restriction enzyme KpnI [Desulfosporosinus acididurans]|uniref:Type-2 restriction enzyme KpnI n=1 Tax=Desulfosporosinus acididurans TaxID=476652 RepID=A0A0J1ILU8_9FIRM|nr:hypothetical protein [Desulfosporosinus acididurans]KLU65681.1 type-2 restriction enzyme KpnI [Desulfosporosinus acididurans]
MEHLEYASIKKELYNQKSIKKRIEALFLNNIGKIITNNQLVEVAKDPITGKEPENWHQRLSELRTDDGYTILSQRDRNDLKLGEYLMLSTEKRAKINKRVYPSKECWKKVLQRANNSCEWSEGGQICGLKDGDVDPIGGGKVKLTADHLQPHSFGQKVDVNNPDDWQALCGRHQVVKKNFWDSKTGKLNIKAILQAIPTEEKEIAYEFLRDYFNK